jgi:cell division protein FtsW
VTIALPHPSLRGRADTRQDRRARAVVGVNTNRFWAMASIVTVLNVIGALMIISASSVESVRRINGTPWYFAQQQMKWTVVGLVGLTIMLTRSIQTWRRWSRVLYVLSLIPLAAVLLPQLGASRNGASRWIALGPINFQPSEFVKLALLLVVARALTESGRRLDDWRESLLPALLWMLPVVFLIMLQPNLGTSLIIVATVLAMVWVAGVRTRAVAGVGVLGAVLAAIAVKFTTFRSNRLTAFLDLKGNLATTGYQPGQALVGFANGGLFGKGLGRSTIKWGYLPYPYNDYILAVIGEEFGLLGTLFVLGMFLAFIAVGCSIAKHARDRFSMLVAAGVTAWIGCQALMNMAVVTSVIPSTGVPLPFISFGGSAQIVNLAAVGLLLNVARHPGDRRLRHRDPEVEAVHRRFEVVGSNAGSPA